MKGTRFEPSLFTVNQCLRRVQANPPNMELQRLAWSTKTQDLMCNTLRCSFQPDVHPGLVALPKMLHKKHQSGGRFWDSFKPEVNEIGTPFVKVFLKGEFGNHQT